MGYTHYMRRPAVIPQENWNDWATDVRSILANLPSEARQNYTNGAPDILPLTLAYEEDEPNRPPLVNNTIVRFNGAPCPWGHETFYVRRMIDPSGPLDYPDVYGDYFWFCKTAQKPYDLIVCACLIRLATHCPAVTVTSDGDWDDQWWGHPDTLGNTNGWMAALALCANLSGSATLTLNGDERHLP